MDYLLATVAEPPEFGFVDVEECAIPAQSVKPTRGVLKKVQLESTWQFLHDVLNLQSRNIPSQ